MPSLDGLNVRITPVERTEAPFNFFQTMARAAAGRGRGGGGGGGGGGGPAAPMIDYMVDPKTGQLVPIVGRSDKMREMNIENMNQYRARMALFGDGTEANPGDESIRQKLADFENMSVERQSEVINDIRRTDIPRLAQATGLDANYFINLALGNAEQINREQRQAIKQQGAGGTFYDSLRIGLRGVIDGVQDLFSDSAAQMARAEQRRDYIANITNENAVLRNRALRQAEGAGFFDRTSSGLGDELAASLGEFVGASAPMFLGAGVGGAAMRFGAGRLLGSAAGAASTAADAAAVANRLRTLNRATAVGSSIGGGLLGMPTQLNATVDTIANNPDLTMEQKQQAIDEAYGPSVAFGAGLGAITMPFGGPAARWLSGRRALAGRGSSNVAQAVRARQAAGGRLPEGVTNPNYWDDVIHNARMRDYALENAGLSSRAGAYLRSLPDTAFEGALLGGAMQAGTNVIANESMGIGGYDPMENVGTAALMGVAAAPMLNMFNLRRPRPVDSVRVDNQGRMIAHVPGADGSAVTPYADTPRELSGVPQFVRGVDNQLLPYTAPARPEGIGLGNRPRPNDNAVQLTPHGSGAQQYNPYRPYTPESARSLRITGPWARERQTAAEGFGFGSDVLNRAGEDMAVQPFTREWAAAQRRAAQEMAEAAQGNEFGFGQDPLLNMGMTDGYAEFGFGQDPLLNMGMSDTVETPTPAPSSLRQPVSATPEHAPLTPEWAATNAAALVNDPVRRANQARADMDGFGFGPDVLSAYGQNSSTGQPRAVDTLAHTNEIREKPIYQTMSKGQRQRKRRGYVNAKRLRDAQHAGTMVDTNEGFAPREPRVSGRDLMPNETGGATRARNTEERVARQSRIANRGAARDPVNSLVREVRNSHNSDEAVMQAVDDAIARAMSNPSMALTNLADLLRGVRQSAEVQRGRGQSAAKEMERLDYAESALLDAMESLAGTEYRAPDRSRNIRGPLDLPQGTTPEVVAVFEGARTNGKGGNITLDQARANMARLVDDATLGENGATGTSQIIENVERFLDAPNVGNYFNKRQRGLLLYASNRARTYQLERVDRVANEFGFGNELERYGQEAVDHSEFGFGDELSLYGNAPETVVPITERVPQIAAEPNEFGFNDTLADYGAATEANEFRLNDTLAEYGAEPAPMQSQQRAAPAQPAQRGRRRGKQTAEETPVVGTSRPMPQPDAVNYSQAELLEMSPGKRARALRMQTNTNAIQRARARGDMLEPQGVATTLRDTTDPRIKDRPDRPEPSKKWEPHRIKGLYNSPVIATRRIEREMASMPEWIRSEPDDTFLVRFNDVLDTTRALSSEQARVDALSDIMLKLRDPRYFQSATAPEHVQDRVLLAQTMTMDALEELVRGTAPAFAASERRANMQHAFDFPAAAAPVSDVFNGIFAYGRGEGVGADLDVNRAVIGRLVDRALSTPDMAVNRENARQLIDRVDYVLDAPNVNDLYNKRQRYFLAHARERARHFELARNLEERAEYGLVESPATRELVQDSFGFDDTFSSFGRTPEEIAAASAQRALNEEFGLGALADFEGGANPTLNDIFPRSTRVVTNTAPGQPIRNRMDGIDPSKVSIEAMNAFEHVTDRWLKLHPEINESAMLGAMRQHMTDEVLPSLDQTSQIQLLEMLRSREDAQFSSYRKWFNNQRVRNAVRAAIETLESRPYGRPVETANAPNPTPTTDPDATSGGWRPAPRMEPADGAGEGSAVGADSAGDSGAQTGAEGSAPATSEANNTDLGTGRPAVEGRGDAGTETPDTGAVEQVEGVAPTEAPEVGNTVGERGAGTTAPVDAEAGQGTGSAGPEGGAGESGSGNVAGTRSNTEPGSVDGSGSDKQVVAPETPVTPNEGSESLTSTPEVMDGLARVINDANAKLTTPAEAAPAPAQSQTRTTTRKRAPRAAKTTAVGPEEMTVQKPTRNGKWENDDELINEFVEPAYEGRGKSRKWKGTALDMGAYSREYSEGITNARLFRYPDDPYDGGGPSVLLHFYNNGTDNSAKVYEVGLHASADFEGWTAKNSRDFPKRWEWFPDNDTDAGFVTYDRGRLIFDPSKAGDELRTLLGQRNTRMGVEFRSRDGEHVFADPDEFQIPTWYLLDNGRLPAQDTQGRRTSAELAADAQAPLVNTDEVAPNSPTTLAQVEATAEAANTSAKKKGGKKAGLVNKTPVRQKAVQKATAQDGAIQTESGPFKGDDVEPATNNADKTTEQVLQEAAADNVARETRKLVQSKTKAPSARRTSQDEVAAARVRLDEAHRDASLEELETGMARISARLEELSNQYTQAPDAPTKLALFADMRALRRELGAMTQRHQRLTAEDAANPNAVIHDELNNGAQDRSGAEALVQTSRRLAGDEAVAPAQVFHKGSTPKPDAAGSVLSNMRRLLTDPELNKGGEANQMKLFLQMARGNRFTASDNARRLTENTKGLPEGVRAEDVEPTLDTLRSVLGTDALRKAGFIDANARVNGMAETANVLYERGVPEFAVTGKDLEQARALRKQGLTDDEIVDSLFGSTPAEQQTQVMENKNKGGCN